MPVTVESAHAEVFVSLPSMSTRMFWSRNNDAEMNVITKLVIWLVINNATQYWVNVQRTRTLFWSVLLYRFSWRRNLKDLTKNLKGNGRENLIAGEVLFVLAALFGFIYRLPLHMFYPQACDGNKKSQRISPWWNRFIFSDVLYFLKIIETLFKLDVLLVTVSISASYSAE